MIADNPIFIVGMPRSGTKLLRDILNNHPDIFIPPNESKVIPYFLKKYGTAELKNHQLNDFKNEWDESTFVRRLKVKGIYVEWDEWISNLNILKVSEIIKVYYQLLATKNNAKIWGDKTPHYIRHVKLLKSYYPEGRFIHIVRDPRDYSLSVNNAWGKSLYRAAQRWNDYISILNTDLEKLKDNEFIEVKYENLLKKPEYVIQLLCKYIGIRYKSNMLHLKKNSENLGEARGMTSIKTDNFDKWKTILSKKKRNKIEGITLPYLKKYGYCDIEYDGKQIKLNKFHQLILQLWDGVQIILFQIFKTTDKRESIMKLIKSFKKTKV